MAHERVPDWDWKAEARELWHRLLSAGIKVAVLTVFILLHKGLVGYVVPWVFPEQGAIFGQVLLWTFQIAFLMIYVRFAWELVAIFIPALRRVSKPPVSSGAHRSGRDATRVGERRR